MELFRRKFTIMRTIKLVLTAVFLGLCITAIIGCETLENSDDYDPKPWTKRESWENTMPGVPF